jgi:poly(hydroxyalkanoate) granule-associated protein
MTTKRKVRKARGITPTPQAAMLNALHQVWLAGLGAASKTQRGAPELWEELVTEGARVHAETRGAAEKALRGLVGDVQSTINARVEQVRGQAEDVLENLEKIFQTRVHRALAQLGVPTAEQVEGLSKRVEALNSSIGKLARAPKSAGKAAMHGGRKAAHAAAA